MKKKKYFVISTILSKLFYLVWRYILGWSVTGSHPKNLKKYILVVAHHTSNWDFIHGLCFKMIHQITVHFFVKHSLMVGPLGWFMRKIGAIAVNRNSREKRVDTIIKLIKDSDEFIFSVTPEGTRSKVTRWRTGFYYIALGAGVPIVPVGLDYKNKKLVFGDPMYVKGNQQEDFGKLYSFFNNYIPKYPEKSFYGKSD